MRASILYQRVILPAVLIAAGLALLVYGSALHTVPVTEEQEVEESIEIPSAFALPSEFAEGPGFGDPGGMDEAPFVPPPMITKVKRTLFVTADVGEPAILWEVTIGGLARFDTGELKRTYSGAAPSLCPS